VSAAGGRKRPDTAASPSPTEEPNPTGREKEPLGDKARSIALAGATRSTSLHDAPCESIPAGRQEAYKALRRPDVPIDRTLQLPWILDGSREVGMQVAGEFKNRIARFQQPSVFCVRRAGPTQDVVLLAALALWVPTTRRGPPCTGQADRIGSAEAQGAALGSILLDSALGPQSRGTGRGPWECRSRWRGLPSRSTLAKSQHNGPAPTPVFAGRLCHQTRHLPSPARSAEGYQPLRASFRLGSPPSR